MSKKAMWQFKKITWQPQLTHRQILVDSETGAELWASEFWPDSSRSCEEADRLASLAEEGLREDGYEIEHE